MLQPPYSLIVTQSVSIGKSQIASPVELWQCVQISQSIRPAWFKLYTDPDIAKSWASFASHSPRSDGRRPVTSLANIEGAILASECLLVLGDIQSLELVAVLSEPLLWFHKYD